MRRTCCSRTAGVLQLALARQRQQFLVRDAAPEEERQARRQLEIAEAMRAARRDVRGIALDAKHESRAREDGLQGCLDARLERPLAPALIVETDERLQVGVGHRPPIRAAGQGAENLLGARQVGGRVGRTARKNPPAARRVAGTGGVERTGDRQRLNVGQSRPIERVHGAADERLEPPRVAERQVPHEGHANRPRSRLHRHSRREPRFDGVSRFLRLLEHRRQIGVSADRRKMDPLAIHRDFHLVRVVHAADVAEVGCLEIDLEARTRRRAGTCGERASRRPSRAAALRRAGSGKDPGEHGRSRRRGRGPDRRRRAR